jgi:hypothetical protein
MLMRKMIPDRTRKEGRVIGWIGRAGPMMTLLMMMMMMREMRGTREMIRMMTAANGSRELLHR